MSPADMPFLSAVFFDLDGTLIDSEPIWESANRALAQSRSAEMSDDLLSQLSGLDSTLAMRLVHERLGWIGMDIAGDVAFVQDRVQAAYGDGLRWLPGARELLTAVRAAGFTTGLVTSTYRPLVDIVLSSVGRESFDVVVCGDDGHVPKPDPAPYADAAAALGLDPSCCVAIEDSPRGVASAFAAGCVVLNVSRSGAVPSAHAHVPDLTRVEVATLVDLYRGSGTSCQRDGAPTGDDMVQAEDAVEVVHLV